MDLQKIKENMERRGFGVHIFDTAAQAADYLVENTFAYRRQLDGDLPWSDPIWDVSAIGWLLNEDCRFLAERRIPVLLPGYDGKYERDKQGRPFTYVWDVKRNELFRDLIEKLTAV